MRPLFGIPVLLAAICVAMSHPVMAVIVVAALYALWRTC